MESETLTTNHRSNILQRVLASAVPVVWIAISYIDPGKWAATVEGGARFGSDVLLLMLVFNCVAILCQYLSACIAVVTGKDLARVVFRLQHLILHVYIPSSGERLKCSPILMSF